MAQKNQTEKAEKAPKQVDILASFRATLEKLPKEYKSAIVPADANVLINKLCFDSPQLTYMFGGFSYDRIHNFFGPESSGKSSMFTYIAGQLQKKMPLLKPEWKDKNKVVYLDFERTFDPNYAENLGLDCSPENLILLHPDTLEIGASIAESLVKSGAVCCVILDSDAAAPTNLDNESNIGDTGFNGAKAANVLKEVYKRFNVLCSNYKFPLLVISQERANLKVGSILPSTTGGTALKFFSSTRCRIQKMEEINDGNAVIGIQIRARNYKNKTSVPKRDALMDLYFDGGFNSSAEYFKFIVEFDLIHKSGGWFKWIDTDNMLGEQEVDKKGNIVGPKTYQWQGGEKAEEWLKEHPEVFEMFKKKVDSMICNRLDSDANNVDPELEDLENAKKSAKEQGIRISGPSAVDKEILAELENEENSTPETTVIKETSDMADLAAQALGE